MEHRVCRVLLDSALPQLDHLFDYLVPDELADLARPGVRVRVPLRSAGRVADGFVIELTHIADSEFGGKLSSIESVVSPVPVLAPEVWRVVRQVADRSAGTASDVVRLAVPGRQVRVEKAWLARRADASLADTSSPEPETEVGRGLVPVSVPVVAGYGHDTIETAIAAGERLAIQAIPRVTRTLRGEWVGEWAVTLAQAAAVTWHSGRSAILVVPDYRDQAQLAAALRDAVPDDAIAAVDARQTNPDRYRGFLRCLEGPAVVLGTRSAVYAPATSLGLIAVWDDGDPLHVEPLSPYVHCRDAALVRQQQQGCALIFAGHTRSVEVQRLVDIGWARSINPDPAVLPRVIPTASQGETGSTAQGARIPTTAWQQARAALERGPVLVQVARPGYTPVLSCQNCGVVARCTICDGPLAMSAANAIPACSWCGALATGWTCDKCDHTVLRRTGVGSGRTADELGRAFPGTRVILADGDHPVMRVTAEPALIVATRGAEPLADGGYHAILLLDGERMLSRESLRVADDCLRWWSNAIALAGPRSPTVLVGVDGFLAKTLVTWQHAAFARRELIDRRELTLPPAVRLVSVSGAASAVEAAVADVGPDLVLDVLGPVALESGLVRSIIRFDYAHGAAVATSLRASVVKNATSRKRLPAKKGAYSRTPTLKIRFDDPEIL